MARIRRVPLPLAALLTSAVLLLALVPQAHGLGAGGPQAVSPVSHSLSEDGRFMVFGPDGDADTPDNSVFATQGIFVP